MSNNINYPWHLAPHWATSAMTLKSGHVVWMNNQFQTDNPPYEYGPIIEGATVFELSSLQWREPATKNKTGGIGKVDLQSFGPSGEMEPLQPSAVTAEHLLGHGADAFVDYLHGKPPADETEPGGCSDFVTITGPDETMPIVGEVFTLFSKTLECTVRGNQYAECRVLLLDDVLEQIELYIKSGFTLILRLENKGNWTARVSPKVSPSEIYMMNQGDTAVMAAHGLLMQLTKL